MLTDGLRNGQMCFFRESSKTNKTCNNFLHVFPLSHLPQKVCIQHYSVFDSPTTLYFLSVELSRENKSLNSGPDSHQSEEH